MPGTQTQKVINESSVNDADSEGYTDLMRAVENKAGTFFVLTNGANWSFECS